MEKCQEQAERQVSSPIKVARPPLQASTPAPAESLAASPGAAEFEKLIAMSRAYDNSNDEEDLGCHLLDRSPPSSPELRRLDNEVLEGQMSPEVKDEACPTTENAPGLPTPGGRRRLSLQAA